MSFYSGWNKEGVITRWPQGGILLYQVPLSAQVQGRDLVINLVSNSGASARKIGVVLT